MAPERSAGVLTALRHVPFALVWAGALVSNVGNWMEVVCQSWLVYEGSHSTHWSGVLGFVATIPAALLAIPMGILADRFDRRRLLLGLQVGLMLVASLQAFAAHAGWTSPATVVAIAFLGGVVAGAAVPAWHALVPELVPREQLGAAIALNSAQFNLARVVGPALAAVVVARFGIATAFDVNVATFALVILALAVIPSRVRHVEPRAWRSELGDAVAFLRRDAALRHLMVLGPAFLLFGAPIFTLLPALADRNLDGQVGTYSTLLSAIGAGAIAGALGLGRLARAASRQRTFVASSLVAAAAVAGLVLARSSAVAVALLVAFGAAWAVLLTTHMTAMQLLVPDRMRGRVMSFQFLLAVTAMPLGQLAGGVIAGTAGLDVALGTAAAGCVGVGVWLLARPVAAAEGTEVRGGSARMLVPADPESGS